MDPKSGALLIIDCDDDKKDRVCRAHGDTTKVKVIVASPLCATATTYAAPTHVDEEGSMVFPDGTTEQCFRVVYGQYRDGRFRRSPKWTQVLASLEKLVAKVPKASLRRRRQVPVPVPALTPTSSFPPVFSLPPPGRHQPGSKGNEAETDPLQLPAVMRGWPFRWRALYWWNFHCLLHERLYVFLSKRNASVTQDCCHAYHLGCLKDVLPRTYEDKHEDGSKERILIVLAECERCPVFPPLKAIVLGQRYLAATSKGKIDKEEAANYNMIIPDIWNLLPKIPKERDIPLVTLGSNNRSTSEAVGDDPKNTIKETIKKTIRLELRNRHGVQPAGSKLAETASEWSESRLPPPWAPNYFQ